MQRKRIKILSLGNSGTGKSTLIKRYCECRFERRYFQTVGIDYGSKIVEINTKTRNEEVKIGDRNEAVNISIDFFDVSGDHEYLEIRNEFYRDVEGVFLVYDICDVSSFDALDKWLREAKRYGLDVQNTPIVLCANKIDQEPRQLSEKNGTEFAKKNRIQIFETSALQGTNVDAMFEYLFLEVVARSI